jgi:hypothetical protein
MKTVQKEYDRLLGKIISNKYTEADRDHFGELQRIMITYDKYRRAGTDRAYENYRNLAGEQESENVRTRSHQGYHVPPWYTQEVPANQQLVSRQSLATGPRRAYQSYGKTDPGIPIEELLGMK